jgi:hypothetical protein
MSWPPDVASALEANGNYEKGHRLKTGTKVATASETMVKRTRYCHLQAGNTKTYPII